MGMQQNNFQAAAERAQRGDLANSEMALRKQREDREGRMTDWTMAGDRQWDQIFGKMASEGASSEQVMDAREVFNRTRGAAQPGGTFGSPPMQTTGSQGPNDFDVRSLTTGLDMNAAIDKLYAKGPEWLAANKDAARRVLETQYQDKLRQRTDASGGSNFMRNLEAINPLSILYGRPNFYTEQGRNSYNQLFDTPVGEEMEGNDPSTRTKQNIWLRELLNRRSH
jgi:hypothetical protein